VLGLIFIILLSILLFVPAKQTQAPQPVQNNPMPTVEGLQVNSPKASEEVSSPIKITGVVTGNGWSGFEGQVGTVKLVDANNKELATGVLTATTEWTTLPINFETTLNFTTIGTTAGTLVFRNENPSGDPARDKTFSLPINLK
jgi:hypothetical protein